MIRENIKYPIAFNTLNQELIDIKKVSSNSRLHLICPECKGGFIAVLNHSTPHFKHKPNTTCSGSFESYLHRIAKDAFKLIDEIEVPEITFDQLDSQEKLNLESSINQILNNHIPKTYQKTFRRSLRKNLVDASKFNIEKYEIEKTYKTELGDVRIDIVCWIKNNEIFLEPYLSNNIDTIKKKKLFLINAPTLSIDLGNFQIMYEDEFSIDKLKEFLINKNSKSWVHIRKEKINDHIQSFISYILGEIQNHKGSIALHNSKLEKINSLRLEQNRIEDKIKPYRTELEKVLQEIRRLERELDNEYD